MNDVAQRFWSDESGQGLSEYALLLGLVIIGVVLFIQGMGANIRNIFGKANNALATANSIGGGGGGGGGGNCQNC